MRKKMISLMMTVAMGTVMISGATVVKADSDEKETVKLAVWSSGAADNFQKGADEFNKRQDKINFVVEMQSGDYSQYLGAKVASNDLPDMFFLNPYTQVQQFAATDRIVDLSEEGFTTKIYDSVKDACSYDGKIYAYPMNLEMLGVYYNQELFEKAGITEVPKTFSQMKEVCEKLQASGITPFAATYKETWTLNHLFSCLQGAAVGDYESWVADMNAGKGSFRNDNSSLEFEFMDMMKENSGGNYMDADSTSGFNAFASGEAAMIVTGEFSLLNAQSINPDLQVGLFGVPLTENEEDAKLDVDVGCVVVVNADSPNVDAALKVLDAISSEESGSWNSYIGDTIGASVPGVPFEASFTAPYLTSYNKYMDEGKIRPWIYQRLKAGAQTIIGESIQGYFAGTMTEDEVIEEMDTRYDDLLNGQ